jgi:hypothetical protein
MFKELQFCKAKVNPKSAPGTSWLGMISELLVLPSLSPTETLKHTNERTRILKDGKNENKKIK